MKKIMFTISLFLFINFDSLYALCDDDELNKIIDEVNVTLVEDSTDTILEDGSVIPNSKDREYAYYLLIGPYSELVNAKVIDTSTDKIYDTKYNSNYGALVYGSYIHFDEKNYLIKIYGSKKSACPNEELKTLNYKVPKYNTNQLSSYCDNHQYDEKCKLDADVSVEEFEEYVEQTEYQEMLNEMNFIEKVWFYIKKYYLYVLIPIVIITLCYLVSIKIYKKKVDTK